MKFPALLFVAYTIVGVPTPSEETSFAQSINAAGVVAGQMGKAAFTWDGYRLIRYKQDQFLYLDGDYTNIATAVNAHGLAVGRNGSYMPVVMSGLEVATAVIFDGGKMTYLDKAENGSFEADGLNDLGWIVGERAYRGFIRKPDGTMIEVKPLSTRDEYNGTRATAINNEGVVVGATTINVPPVGRVQCGEQRQGMYGPAQPMYCPDASKYVIHAFVASFGHGVQHMRDLGSLPGFPDSYATAVSEDGTIVGYTGNESGPKWSWISGPSHAWMWYQGRMSDLGVLHSGDDSAAFGVNDRGVVVGCSGARDGRTGFLYDASNPVDMGMTAVRWVNKHIQNLNSFLPARSRWFLRCARAINSLGWITGDGTYDGVARAFVLVPKN